MRAHNGAHVTQFAQVLDPGATVGHLTFEAVNMWRFFHRQADIVQAVH